MPPSDTDDVRQLVEETDEMEGLGDAVAKVTKRLGIKECRGCRRRRKWLNRKVPFSRNRKKGCASCS